MADAERSRRKHLARGTWLVLGLIGFAVLLGVLAMIFRQPPPPYDPSATSPATAPM